MPMKPRWMMSLLAALCLIGAAGPASAVMASRASRAPAGFAYAYAHSDCAPWDGAAWNITLQNEPVPTRYEGQLPKVRYPLYTVAIWTGKPPLNRWIALPGDEKGQAAGAITACLAEGKCGQRRGRVMLLKWGADRIEGELRVQMSDTDPRELVYPFSAPVLPFQALCG